MQIARQHDLKEDVCRGYINIDRRPHGRQRLPQRRTGARRGAGLRRSDRSSWRSCGSCMPTRQPPLVETGQCAGRVGRGGSGSGGRLGGLDRTGPCRRWRRSGSAPVTMPPTRSWLELSEADRGRRFPATAAAGGRRTGRTRLAARPGARDPGAGGTGLRGGVWIAIIPGRPASWPIGGGRAGCGDPAPDADNPFIRQLSGRAGAGGAGMGRAGPTL